MQFTNARVFHGIDVELYIAAWLIDADTPMHEYRHAVAQWWRAEPIAAKQDTLQRGAFVLDREVAMASAGQGIVGNLAAYPGILQVVVFLQQAFEVAGQFTHADNPHHRRSLRA